MPPEWEPPRRQDPSASSASAQSRPGQPETPAWALTLVRLLDDAVRIPGTRLGVGLDALLGLLFPVVGDAATGLASLALLVLGLQLGVPKVVLVRMVFNILLDTLVGSIPIFGDAFDLFWRSNRKNLALLQRYDRNPDRRAAVADYVIVGLGSALVLAALALPIVLGFRVLRWLWQVKSG